MFYPGATDESGSAKGALTKTAENEAATSYTKSTEVGTGFIDKALEGKTNEWLTELKNQFSVKGFLTRSNILDQEATKIRNIVGLSKESNNQFMESIAKSAANFTQYGYKIEDVADTYEKIYGNLKSSVSVSEETLLNLRTTAQVTGQDMGELVNSFRGVGVGISDIGDRMLEVVNVARNAGVATKAVSDGVIKNLDKMNIYNFEGGTKGLAKMSAQAAKLGIDMTNIFNVVDQVFNPEGAIELSAAMQRLGVQSNALLDPLRLMDLSQNDPGELQNQIVEMSKQFVNFNKELNQFEIMPGEKRRMNEIGKALGMNNGELQKMALNAANLEYKMKQIKLPSFGVKEEDKELIATLATINKEGIAEVKVEKLDAQGKGTGEYTTKGVDELKPEDIENLRKQQEMQGKTMEEIALEQLDQQKIMNQQISKVFTAAAYGISGSVPGREAYNKLTQGGKDLIGAGTDKISKILGIGDISDTETWMKKTNELYAENKDKVFENMNGIFGKMTDGFKDVFGEFLNSGPVKDFEKMFEGFDISTLTSSLGSMSGFISDVVKTASSFGIGGSESDPGSNFIEEVNNVNTNVSNTVNQLATVTNQKIGFEPLDITENINVTIKVDMDPSIKDQALTELATKAINEYFYSGPTTIGNLTNLKSALDDVRKGILITPKENKLVNTG